ncbi:MAG: IMP dehydrogenase [Candidatus Sungbacteria bacterium]|uniref:IMP dehydrogenase n=1 Tax=Candidatus Sungiibacteriota bacterium TaxID=2750080 RepID=A0A932R180_9BACT|nr:IMP dehydrogenase [Candidatus Sungbacteria bacterium]
MADQGLALTFDDVRLKTGYSKVPLEEIKLGSMFSRHVGLNIPIASAAMDTVTEYEMAIEIAKLGGIGVLHRNLSPKEQTTQMKRVKFHLNALTERPITVEENETLQSVERRRQAKNYSFHSFPVLNEDRRLVGLLTRNDFDFCADHSFLVREVMTTELITAPDGTTLDEAYEMMTRGKKKILPLVDREHRLAGMYVFSDVARIKLGSSSIYNLDGAGHLRVGAAVGVDDDALERIELLGRLVDAIVIDTAHGDSEPVLRTLRSIKKMNFSFDVVVGNVSEGGSAKRLVDNGADCVKVGQGPGSICTTRLIAGIGCPQVTAIYNCAKAIEGSGVPICADGGIRYSGDISIAIGAGAHSVMLGRVLAGTKQAPGEMIMHQGAPTKVYRGMGSLAAMEAHRASRARYGQHDPRREKIIPEGVETKIPFQGELTDVLHQYTGGLRSGMGYVGAATIEELQGKADFYRISNAGINESHPHDVTMIADTPNYRKDGP